MRDILVDYEKPVAEVFTDAANAIIRSTRELTLLSHATHVNELRMSGLPSWVPDWSEYPLSLPMVTQVWLRKSKYNASGACPFSADGSCDGWTPPFWRGTTAEILPGGRLKLLGKRIGTVRHVGKIDMDDLSLIYEVLNNIPPIYEYYKTVPLAEISQAPDSPPPAADGLSNMSFYDQDSQGEISDDENEEQSGSMPFPILVRCNQTRFEALWRTLIADTWEFKHPAMTSAGHGMVESLITDIKTAHLQTQFFQIALIHREGAMEGLVDRMASQMQALLSLAEDERSCIELWQAHNPDAMLADSDAESPTRTSPTKYFPSLESLADVEAYEMKHMRMERLWNTHLKEGRLLASTDSRRLVLAPASTLPGDQIWVLNGAKFPFVLRELVDGNFQLVGEAYVHGIMHGETVGLVNGEPLHHHVDTSDIRSITLE